MNFNSQPGADLGARNEELRAELDVFFDQVFARVARQFGEGIFVLAIASLLVLCRLEHLALWRTAPALVIGAIYCFGIALLLGSFVKWGVRRSAIRVTRFPGKQVHATFVPMRLPRKPIGEGIPNEDKGGRMRVGLTDPQSGKSLGLLITNWRTKDFRPSSDPIEVVLFGSPLPESIVVVACAQGCASGQFVPPLNDKVKHEHS